MNLAEAIKFLKENYEDVDEQNRHWETMKEFLDPEVTPETIIRFLMQEEEEEFEDYTTEEWVEMIEKTQAPVDASWLIIQWIWTRKWARYDGKADQEYWASKPDYEEYESPPKRRFKR